MRTGLATHRRSSREGLARRIAARPGGSTAAASAEGGAAPGAGAPGGKPGFHPMHFLKDLEAGQSLTGKQLTGAARALTALEVRPQLHGYRQLANQLHSERETEARGLAALGGQLAGNVTDVYKNIAASEADGLARQQALAGQLNQTSAGIAQQGNQSLEAMQKGQLGGLTAALQIRGAPGGGSAQQELANAVAAQQSAQSANSQANQQFAASQGASYGNLAATLAGTAQLQGGAAVGGIGRDIIGRTRESNQKYDEGIQTALGKRADVKATKGATFVKNLLGLREGEQKFILGKAAVHGEKEGLKLKERENAEDRKQQGFENQLALSKLGLDQWKAHHPNASSGEVQKKAKELKEERNEVKSLIATIVGAEGAPKNDQQLAALTGALNSKASAKPQLVRKVVQAWWEKRRQHPQSHMHR